MKTKKIKKLIAAAMVISTSTTLLPLSTIAMADTNNATVSDTATTSTDNSSSSSGTSSTTGSAVSYNTTTELNNSTTSAAVYYNDFENGQTPDQVSGKITSTNDVSIDTIGASHVMKFSSQFDGTDNWDNNKYEFDFYTSSSDTIPAGSTIQYNLLIPTNQKNFLGTIKCTGALKDGSSAWNWEGASTQDVTTDSFTDLGNGYSSAKVSIKLNSDVSGLNAVVAQISAYNCTYSGELYIDNLKVTAAEAQDDAPLPSVSPLEWNFDTNANGWSYGGNWAYNGATDNVVNYDSSATGSGALKLSLDYSKDVASSWSEFKISKNLDAETSFNGYNLLTYDFIFDPSKMTTGGFQTKLYITDSLNNYGAIDLSKAEDIGNGLKKVQVTLKLTSQDVQANSITLSIIGASTNYKGDIYVDNIKLSQEVADDVYVEKTATTTAQVKVEPGDLGDNRPSDVKLVDSCATSETADLYSYLMGIGKTDYVLYGHQNDIHHKAGSGSTNSDTKDITGSISAIVGIDALSLTGSELSLTDEEKAAGKDLISKAADLSIDASSEGGIITLSAHMPNFELVKEKGKDANGHYDYSGYTPGTTTGNIVSRIMPGGDLNDVYVGYLDMLATYAHKLETAGVPVIFRPFHENNGSWFWWGKAFCDEEAYKNMYRYTVQYLRDTENVHNFLYVYSPNGPFTDQADYLSRYPGDEFVDILAFDYYDDNPTADASTDPWMASFKNTINLVQGIAKNRGKLSAVSEVGLRNNDSHGFMAISGNADKDWFSHVANIVSKSDMPYYMTWANFGETSGFFAPYMVSDTKGHEMINNFIDYYNEDESVFANGVGDYSSASTGIDSAYSYGFITGPASSSRIFSPTTITASVKGYNGQIKFVLKNKAGEAVETINATQGENEVYSAQITQEMLDKIGQTIGSIELYSDDTKLDTIEAIFNIKEAEKNPKVVDDFESYSGEDVLLQNTWSTNYGSGCSVTPKLDTNNKNSGDYGLAFNYKIAPNGWTGITQSLDADWSDCDALQIWVKPDGKGQKLVIQLTSNGEDFEVWMPEFAATTEPKLLTIPFSQFKGKNNGTFDPAHIQKMGIWCNTIGSDTVDSVMYFDDIKAVNTNAPEGGDTNTGGNQTGGSTEAAMPSTVTINGTEKVGEILTAELLKADLTEFTSSQDVTYAWYRLSNKDDSIANSTVVGTDKTYRLTGGDKGYYIKLVATYNGKKFENITSYIARNSSSNSSSSSSSSSSSNNGSTTTSTTGGTSTTTTSNTSTTTALLTTNADGTVKLVDKNGQAVTGWQQVNGAWYLADANGTVQKGWQLVNGTWYFMAPTGVMQTGWQQVNDNWYLMASTGAMQAGWQQVNGKWYLLASSGAMQTGWQEVDGKWYYLYADGSMASDTVIDGYRVDSSGAWV
ncbi:MULTISPECIES: glycosyl hydrolase [unclassified Clostridium]|uniref:glycosyl hydrolase n=1 Tax=unclassified Clostridium TaxID=2614128 RepID=UPI0002984BA6|nr:MULTISPECIES: glycosyl hydrolase [unclassified Clostridium]EKQ56491.1 MAG: putative cell wall binding protein [Clostridium sp. Maddingley MBC34-26]